LSWRVIIQVLERGLFARRLIWHPIQWPVFFVFCFLFVWVVLNLLHSVEFGRSEYVFDLDTHANRVAQDRGWKYVGLCSMNSCFHDKRQVDESSRFTWDLVPSLSVFWF